MSSGRSRSNHSSPIHRLLWTCQMITLAVHPLNVALMVAAFTILILLAL
jgi:hypothetical protein